MTDPEDVLRRALDDIAFIEAPASWPDRPYLYLERHGLVDFERGLLAEGSYEVFVLPIVGGYRRGYTSARKIVESGWRPVRHAQGIAEWDRQK